MGNASVRYRVAVVVLLALTTSVMAPAPAIAHPAPFEVVVLGGPATVSEAVADQLDDDRHDVVRLADEDRYGTAAAISASRFGPGITTAFVATGEDFADALAGGPWAARSGGPILLTRHGDLPEPTRAEILRLSPDRVVILGGPSAVSPVVEAELADLVPTVERIGGDSRVETAVLVAQASHPSGAGEVAIARADDFADALTAGPLMAARDGVILLSDTNQLPDRTRTELQRLDPDRITVLGGTAAIDEDVEAELATLADSVERVAGATRTETAVAISAAQFAADTARAVYVANAGAFPDALAGAALAGGTGGTFAGGTFQPNGPILLTDTDRLPDATATEIRRLHPTIDDPDDNLPPVAEDIDAIATENVPRIVPLVATDPDGDPLTYAIVDQPSSGSVTIDGDDARFVSGLPGQRTFTYTASDGQATSNVATVTVTVRRRSGAPTSPIVIGPDTFDAFGNTQLVITPDLGTGPDLDGPGVRIQDNLLDNDTDTGGGTLDVVPSSTGTANGGTVTTYADGSFSYLPPVGYTGADDTFTYTVTNGTDSADGTVTVSLTDMIWFLDADAPPGGDGRSHAPLDTVPATIGGAGDTIHIGESAAAIGGAGITLVDGQQLLGVGAALEVGPGPTTLVPAGIPPVLESTASGVALVHDNTVRGLDIGSTAGDGIAIDGGSGTFTLDSVTITDSSGACLRVDSTVGDITIQDSTITQTNDAAGIDITSHTGTFSFGPTNTLDATNGTGLQFTDADGTYDVTAGVTLNGGDAGIDILNGSAGTFTFADTTTITNPTGAAVLVRDFDAPGQLDYDGSIVNDNGELVLIDTTAAGSSVRFNTNGGNSLTSTGPPGPSIDLFDVDGDLTITTPTTATDSQFSPLFATDGSGTWTFHDLTIIDLTGLNGGVDVFGNTGTVNFHNLDITTDSAGTGAAATGFLAGGNNVINVTGTNRIDADGGPALVLIDTVEVDMKFESLTARNNLSSQIGFSGDDGVNLLSVGAGSITVVGTTTVANVDEVGIRMDGVGADVTFGSVAIDTVGEDAVSAGAVFTSTGALRIDGGSISNTGREGLRFGGIFDGTSANATVDGVAFSSIGGFVVQAANSTLAGTGNTAAPFSCNDQGGNTGFIAFNGGADTCP
ncbi:hypothetical protein DVS28_a0322 [Euzebya pacifica]|uniref:Uncharacterized protein n=1 Tax=Euzebya pacifica TaxID=1608957 RepID=A0A346XS32_9ACTN|nr:cell wall-binding repeat-containing protein [Euzebya pacifica]AXV05029.1 hypothetical protein DVS28_a0322 [Euzebya pacifica]